jgi:hypothetical protein
MNKHDTIENNTGCPPEEVVSAYFDGELTKDLPEYEHISNCEKCQQRLKEYEEISRLLTQEIVEKVPDDLVSRIQAGVRRELAKNESVKPSKNIAFPGFYLKIAAAVVICGILSFVIIENNRNESQTTNNQPIPTVIKEPNSFNPGNAINATGAIPLEDFARVNFGANSDPVELPPGFNNKKNAQPPTTISDNVHQVWVSKNIPDTVKIIRKVSKRLGIDLNQEQLAQTENSLKLRMLLTQKQLVLFVRLCKESGLDLMSRTAPQPEQKLFTGEENDPVQYFADFVLQQK